MSRRTVEFRRKLRQLGSEARVEELFPNKVVKSDGHRHLHDGDKQLSHGRATDKVGTRPMRRDKARRLYELA